MALILSLLLQLLGISCEPTGATVRLVLWTEEAPTQHLAGVSATVCRVKANSSVWLDL